MERVLNTFFMLKSKFVFVSCEWYFFQERIMFADLYEDFKMKHIMAFVLLSFLCVFTLPVSAHKIDKERLAEIKKEQIERDIRYLCDRTEYLENQVRKENRANHAQSAKRVDRDYLPKLKKAARHGDFDLWNMIHQDYMSARKSALANDKKAYEAKQAKKKENPWYREPVNH